MIKHDQCSAWEEEIVKLKKRIEELEGIVTINSKNSDDCYCLCCDSLIEKPELTGGFCNTCFGEVLNET